MNPKSLTRTRGLFLDRSNTATWRPSARIAAVGGLGAVGEASLAQFMLNSAVSGRQIFFQRALVGTVTSQPDV